MSARIAIPLIDPPSGPPSANSAIAAFTISSRREGRCAGRTGAKFKVALSRGVSESLSAGIWDRAIRALCVASRAGVGYLCLVTRETL